MSTLSKQVMFDDDGVVWASPAGVHVLPGGVRSASNVSDPFILVERQHIFRAVHALREEWEREYITQLCTLTTSRAPREKWEKKYTDALRILQSKCALIGHEEGYTGACRHCRARME